jgi:uncharacterized lipoprotein YddW (UPF0748 family)
MKNTRFVSICRSFLLLLMVVSTAELLKAKDIPPKREFRGVWIATVVNIDWPSKAGLSTEEQQKELLALLDNHQRAGINAVVLQIRPTADALYANSKEPWSRFLTGSQGKAPNPHWDPLAFAIEEAHKRGMELHPWFNPYRATFDLAQQNVLPSHITRQKPEWFFTYGGKKWFNPGIPEVRNYIVDVIMHVVRHYDIDGVHFDDYFYPYPDGNKPIPDTETFKKYGKNFKNIADWRRDNVNTLIQTLSDSIRMTKKHLRFGISPFGIWDNKRDHPIGSETSGFSGYRQLYADALAWTKAGWIDYISPQLYWTFQFKAAPYEKLVDWWSHHTYGKHLYIGHASYRVANTNDGWANKSQLPDQVRYLRNHGQSQGSIFYSSKSIANNLVGIRDSMQYDLYKYKALPPLMPWLDSIAPLPPKAVEAKMLNNAQAVHLTWEAADQAVDGDLAYGYVIYRFDEGEEIRFDHPKNILHISYDAKMRHFTDHLVRPGATYVYYITALDRIKNESQPSNMRSVLVSP